MHEFPQHFRGMGGIIGGLVSAIGAAMTGWNPNAMCDGIRAEERSIWLQQNDGLTQHAAQQKVTNQFPEQFGGGIGGGYDGGSSLSVSVPAGCHWNGHAICDGKRAEERRTWLMQNQGMTAHNARNTVMNQYPAMFGGGMMGGGMMGGGMIGGGMWNPNAICDGKRAEKRAEERATWLMQNQGMTAHNARNTVMNQYPAMFGGGGMMGGGMMGGGMMG